MRRIMDLATIVLGIVAIVSVVRMRDQTPDSAEFALARLEVAYWVAFFALGRAIVASLRAEAIEKRLKELGGGA